MRVKAWADVETWLGQPISPDPEILAERKWPRVTLVTPSYQQAPYLGETIQSVLLQGYPELEYFVFDGGSSDGSKVILEAYHHQLTYWESAPDRGQSHAINKGWRRASGKYLWWLNSDDLLTPGSLFRSVAYLEDHPGIGMVYGDLLLIDEHGGILGPKTYADFDYGQVLQSGQDISQAGGLMRRSCIGQAGFLNEDLHFMMDLEYWHRLALAGIGIQHLSEYQALFRVYDETKTQSSSPRVVEERYHIARMIEENASMKEYPGLNVDRLWSNTYLISGRNCAKAGSFGKGARECWRSLRRRPRRVFDANWWHTLLINLAGLILGRTIWLRLRSRKRSFIESGR